MAESQVIAHDESEIIAVVLDQATQPDCLVEECPSLLAHDLFEPVLERPLEARTPGVGLNASIGKAENAVAEVLVHFGERERHGRTRFLPFTLVAVIQDDGDDAVADFSARQARLDKMTELLYQTAGQIFRMVGEEALDTGDLARPV